MNRLIITGSRNPHRYVKAVLSATHAEEPIDELILGCAKGVDRQALMWALENDVFFVLFTADWELLKKAAGNARNRKMVAYGALEPSARCLGFPHTESVGTINCMNTALDYGLIVYRVLESGTIVEFS